MRILTLALFAMAFSFFSARGQSASPEVIASSGNHFSSPNAQISWTLGESVIATQSSPNAVLTQGFHQTNLVITALGEDPLNSLKISVFPNPTLDLVNIKREDSKGGLSIKLLSIEGKSLAEKKISQGTNETSLNLTELPAGVYFLRISGSNHSSQKTFKVEKIK